MNLHRHIVVAVVAALIAPCSPSAFAREQTPMAVQDQADAKTALMHMAEFIAQLPRFSVTIRIGYDIVQPNGQKIEFGEVRELIIDRPQRMRIDVKRSDGDQELLVFDGKTMTIYDVDNNAYAMIDKAGDLDGVVTYFVKDLQMRLPLALLFITSLPAQLDQRLKSIAFVERSVILDVPCDHIAARADNVDFQVWIAAGDQPLPRRVVITYRNAEGEPQFRAQFSDWNLAPATPDSLFTFTPPTGAEQIPLIVAAPGGPRQTEGQLPR